MFIYNIPKIKTSWLELESEKKCFFRQWLVYAGIQGDPVEQNRLIDEMVGILREIPHITEPNHHWLASAYILVTILPNLPRDESTLAPWRAFAGDSNHPYLHGLYFLLKAVSFRYLLTNNSLSLRQSISNDHVKFVREQANVMNKKIFFYSFSKKTNLSLGLPLCSRAFSVDLLMYNDERKIVENVLDDNLKQTLARAITKFGRSYLHLNRITHDYRDDYSDNERKHMTQLWWLYAYYLPTQLNKNRWFAGSKHLECSEANYFHDITASIELIAGQVDITSMYYFVECLGETPHIRPQLRGYAFDIQSRIKTSQKQLRVPADTLSRKAAHKVLAAADVAVTFSASLFLEEKLSLELKNTFEVKAKGKKYRTKRAEDEHALIKKEFPSFLKSEAFHRFVENPEAHFRFGYLCLTEPHAILNYGRSYMVLHQDKVKPSALYLGKDMMNREYPNVRYCTNESWDVGLTTWPEQTQKAIASKSVQERYDIGWHEQLFPLDSRCKVDVPYIEVHIPEVSFTEHVAKIYFSPVETWGFGDAIEKNLIEINSRKGQTLEIIRTIHPLEMYACIDMLLINKAYGAHKQFQRPGAMYLLRQLTTQTPGVWGYQGHTLTPFRYFINLLLRNHGCLHKITDMAATKTMLTDILNTIDIEEYVSLLFKGADKQQDLFSSILTKLSSVQSENQLMMEPFVCVICDRLLQLAPRKVMMLRKDAYISGLSQKVFSSEVGSNAGVMSAGCKLKIFDVFNLME
tara:strand:+ start:7779 stop:10016 length:2238 start_codon:yes stop_codon:yes gene_type:complete